MDFSASHTGYVVAAFAISALTLAALVFWIIRNDRKLRREVRQNTETNL